MTDSTQSLILERELPHPPEKIWRALTQNPLIEQWLLKNDFEPVVGHRFQFRAPPMPQWNGLVDCEVLAIEPNRRLCYSWNVGKASLGGLETVVIWTLTPTKTGTHVRMEQTGFGPGKEANYKGAAYGWKRFLDGLEKVVAGLQ